MNERQAAVLVTLLESRPAVHRAILEQFGTAKEFFQREPVELEEGLRKLLLAYGRDTSGYLAQAEEFLDCLVTENIELLPWGDRRYPLLLREVHHPPPLLFVRGNLTALSLPQVAIVGSRNASAGGIRLAHDFAAALASAGFAITSGMALGIDGAAHRGALQGGKTIAVLGAGVDVIYPRRHESLYHRIVDQGGAVVSEFLPGSPPLRQHFPRRNRIISGLCAGVLVVEAAPKSGSLITARLAMEQGREVFAIPGSIHNPQARGCHQLIREGATLVETVDDLVAQLGGLLAFKSEEAAATPFPLPEKPEERKLLNAMGYDLVDFDSLLHRTGLESSVLTPLLVNLEIQGYIESGEGGYRRIR